MTTAHALTDEQVAERAVIIFESDVTCPCGSDPRSAEAHRDAGWFVDMDGDEATVRCPACW